MDTGDEDGGTAPAALRKLGGVVCLLLSLTFLALVVMSVEDRLSRRPVEVSGFVKHVGTHTDLGQPRRGGIYAAALVVILEERLVDGRYQPEFSHLPSVWPNDVAEELAEELPAGTFLQMTVDGDQLEDAKEHLLGRHRLESSGGIYTPPFPTAPTSAEIITLVAGGETLIDTRGEFSGLALLGLFLTVGATMFAAVGLALVRS